MGEKRREEMAELAAELRTVRDELAHARQERAGLLKDLEALQARLIKLELENTASSTDARKLANEEFLDRQRREQAQVARLRKLARPFQSLPGFDAVERAARRARAKRRS